MNRLFLCCSAVNFIAEGHFTAFTPLLLHDLGLTTGEVAVWSGLLFAIMMATALPLAPFWGVLAERYSRKPVILRAYFVMAAALLLAAWAPNLAWVALSRMLVGLCFGTMGVVTATQALLTPRNKLGSAIATLQAANPIGGSLGPPVGSLLIPWIGLRGLFVLDAVAVFLTGLALLALMPEPTERITKGSILGRTREVLGLVWSIPPIRWNFISAFLLRGATAVVDSYLPVRITQIATDPATAIGWILGIYGVVTTAATWLVGRIVDRANESVLYWRAMLFGTVVTFGLAVAPWLWLLGVLAALRAFATAFSNTLLHTHIARAVPPEQQTPIFSLAPVPRNSGALLLPLLAAGIAGLAHGAALLAGAAGYGATFLSGLKMAGQTRPRAHPQPNSSRPALEA